MMEDDEGETFNACAIGDKGTAIMKVTWTQVTDNEGNNDDLADNDEGDTNKVTKTTKARLMIKDDDGERETTNTTLETKITAKRLTKMTEVTNTTNVTWTRK